MNHQYRQVKEFHQKFGSPVRELPQILAPERVAKRYAWMLEEINEFRDAATLDEQADAMIDLIYFALGSMVEMGAEPEELFDIVHRANMSKLWEDGKPHYDKGKVIKPPGWKDPKPLLEQEIERQIRLGKVQDI